jgi:glucose-6-phosphate-specific signal transduction histidine kinase
MQIDLYDGVYHIIITDNGRASSDTTTEGGGLTGMRKKLEAHNGTLMVNSRMEFVLSINLPEGNSNV